MRTTHLTTLCAAIGMLAAAGAAPANTYTTSNWTATTPGSYNWNDNNWDTAVPNSTTVQAVFNGSASYPFTSGGAYAISIGSPISLAALNSSSGGGKQTGTTLTLSGSDITLLIGNLIWLGVLMGGLGQGRTGLGVGG